jgi:Mg2+ and Co2+ transporter CorA
MQIRTIEQNELAIIRDVQERAIRLVTGVTIIFLPLSFCTSYFGMNLQGIVGTSRSEGYFWYVCGTTALGIIVVVILYALRHRIKQNFMKKQLEFAAT